MSFDSISETAIFERIVLRSGSASNEWSSVLVMQFAPEDQERMQFLADKAKQGTLSSDEETEIEIYERVGHYLAILQSKVRVALSSTADRDSISATERAHQLEQFGRRAGWDDPKMDVYDDLDPRNKS